MGYVPPPNETAPGALEEMQRRYIRQLVIGLIFSSALVVLSVALLLDLLLRHVAAF